MGIRGVESGMKRVFEYERERKEKESRVCEEKEKEKKKEREWSLNIGVEFVKRGVESCKKGQKKRVESV